mgnify:CR=1 FL=1|jgi:5'-deoxynucleotidase YfbR-like HD superfamily hydrolase|tara:strand:- start:5544 stop:6044 length:501 start_codon:yes stop_codon:yes gene_type:complete
MNLYTELYKLGDLVRFNNTPTIHKETVAEHSYFVVAFTKILCDEFKLSKEDKTTAIEMAIVHDIPEILVSDIPHNVKKAFKPIKKAIQDCEFIAAKELLTEHEQRLFKEFEEQKTKISLIVKLADILSVICYSSREANLGNEYMRKINKDATKIYNDVKMQIRRIK